MMGRHEERRASVAAWMKSYRTRIGTVSSRFEVEEALEAGLRFNRHSSRLVEFVFVPPNRTNNTNSERWTIKMGMRGLEWLVQEIYD